jgi:hypothetical protein
MGTEKFRLDPENVNDVSEANIIICLSTQHTLPSTLPLPYAPRSKLFLDV